MYVTVSAAPGGGGQAHLGGIVFHPPLDETILLAGRRQCPGNLLRHVDAFPQKTMWIVFKMRQF